MVDSERERLNRGEGTLQRYADRQARERERERERAIKR